MVENKLEKLKVEFEKAQEKAREYELKAQLKKNKIAELERKERTRRLIQHGGLVEMVLGGNFDKGFLVGLLLENKEIFLNSSSAFTDDKNFQIKLKGDKLIAERENRVKK